MMLAIAIFLFSIFVGDVLLGALAGSSFLTDVQGMLMLFGASIAFVAAIINREKNAKRTKE